MAQALSIWPVEALSRRFLCPYGKSPSFFELFITFLAVDCSRLLLYFAWSSTFWDQPFLLETLVHLVGKWFLERASLVSQMVKNLPAMWEIWVWPWVGKIHPPQYFCLENSNDRGAWQVTIHGIPKSWTWLSDFHFTPALQADFFFSFFLSFFTI